MLSSVSKELEKNFTEPLRNLGDRSRLGTDKVAWLSAADVTSTANVAFEYRALSTRAIASLLELRDGTFAFDRFEHIALEKAFLELRGLSGKHPEFTPAGCE